MGSQGAEEDGGLETGLREQRFIFVGDVILLCLGLGKKK